MDSFFDRGVDGAGGVVENRGSAGRTEQRTGKGDPLALPAGEGQPALADDGVVALAGAAWMNSCAWAARAAASTSSSACLRAAVGDVGAHRGREQEALLEHDPDLAAQRSQGDVRGRRARRPGPRPRSGVVEA